MALFGLNWEESKWPWQFCYIVLYFFASKIGVKLPPGIKVPWHWRGPGRSSASNYHFSQKNAFFGQKKAFFQRFHFIQKWSVTPNTIFECVKNDFLLYYQKLVFFTEFNLHIENPKLSSSCNVDIKCFTRNKYGIWGIIVIESLSWTALNLQSVLGISFIVYCCKNVLLFFSFSSQSK